MEEYGKWATFQCEMKNQRQAYNQRTRFSIWVQIGARKSLFRMSTGQLCVEASFMQAPTGVGRLSLLFFRQWRRLVRSWQTESFTWQRRQSTATVAKETVCAAWKKWLQGKNYSDNGQGKAMSVWWDGMQSGNLSVCKGAFWQSKWCGFDLLHRCEMIERDDILSQADRYTVCPFELCLDTASWCDNIICDYNYVFDPNVYLKRFFRRG